MDNNNINCFYYFGKLPDYTDFVGSTPTSLIQLLDFYALRLNENPVSIRKEIVLFCIPTRHYRSFLAGVIWNSEDSFHRQYPFTLYLEITSSHCLSFFPFLLLDMPKILEVLNDAWLSLLNLNWKTLKTNLSFHQNIASIEGNKLACVSSPMPVVSVIPSTPWYSLKPYFSLKNEIQKDLTEFADSFIHNMPNFLIKHRGLEWVIQENPCVLAFDKQSVFAQSLEEYSEKKNHY